MAHLPRRTSHWVIDQVGEDVIAYDPDTDAVHLLSSDAGKVLPLCDGVTSVPAASLATGMSEEAVELTIHTLADLGLLQGVTRRAALQRSALIGGGILVATSFGSLASAHASIVTPPDGGSGSNTYRTAVLAAGPLAYFRLGEAQGAGMAVDETGNHNSPYSSDRPAPVPGATGDGSTAFPTGADINVDLGGLLQNAAAFTLEYFVQTSEANTDPGGAQWYNGAGLVDAEEGNVVNDFGTTLFGGHVLFGIGNGDTTIASPYLGDGAWHHIAATWSTAGVMTLYVDGGAVTSAPTSTEPRSNAPLLFIGPSYSGAGASAPASIDEVAIYNTVLSAGTIAAHYAAR